MDRGAGIVHPMDGDFLDSVAKALRQNKDFHIESPAVDAGGPENLIRGLGGERLEAALSVPNSPQQ